MPIAHMNAPFSRIPPVPGAEYDHKRQQWVFPVDEHKLDMVPDPARQYTLGNDAHTYQKAWNQIGAGSEAAHQIVDERIQALEGAVKLLATIVLQAKLVPAEKIVPLLNAVTDGAFETPEADDD